MCQLILTISIAEIQIYEERKPNGQWLKSIRFKLPIIENDLSIGLDNGEHVKTVVLLSHKKPDSHINVKVEFGEGEGKVPLKAISERAEAYKPKERVTYKMIKEYIEAKYGFKVHTAYIAEVKRDLGLPMYDAPNAVEEFANSHFLRPAGPHFPASQGHIKRPVLEIGRAERGLRPANQYRALSQKAMLSQSVR